MADRLDQMAGRSDALLVKTLMIGWAGAAAIAVMTACSLVPIPHACPTALLEGLLAFDDHGGALVMTEFGRQPVRWPDGYRVEQAPNVVLRDAWGMSVATEGDTVYVGGGMDAADEVFVACGYVSRDPP
jgi:hypothetical protein